MRISDWSSDVCSSDLYWFAVVLTINMEIGLITPPVGLNLYVINGIAPDIALPAILKGALPFMLAMVIGIVLLCFFPSIATRLPNAMLGLGIRSEERRVGKGRERTGRGRWWTEH